MSFKNTLFVVIGLESLILRLYRPNPSQFFLPFLSTCLYLSLFAPYPVSDTCHLYPGMTVAWTFPVYARYDTK